MSIFTHQIYDTIRTRVIVIHDHALLLLPPSDPDSAWRLPGGGLEPYESLADCAVREVQEETGLTISVLSIAFLREWVVPTYCSLPDAAGRVGFGLEVYVYASPRLPLTPLRAESATDPLPCWVDLTDVPALPLWPKELKALAGALATGAIVVGVPSFVSQLEHPLAVPPPIMWNVPISSSNTSPPGMASAVE
jgi:8-oxo-dGTP pyrophosphatase MutT (NUDIX family)